LALSDIDRRLIERCLSGGARAWEDFVDRFIGLVVHVVNHTAERRSVRLSGVDREDLIADVFLAIVEDDHAVLRRFRGQSSLATYLTVVARRVVVRKVLSNLSGEVPTGDLQDAVHVNGAEQRIADRDQVQQLMKLLDGPEAEAVRLFHLEGKSYQEVSHFTGLPVNSIGPLLSRAREKLRAQASAE
jgi:RNA polymerase sigma-70 factor (ECF subfamily)